MLAADWWTTWQGDELENKWGTEFWDWYDGIASDVPVSRMSDVLGMRLRALGNVVNDRR